MKGFLSKFLIKPNLTEKINFYNKSMFVLDDYLDIYIN